MIFFFFFSNYGGNALKISQVNSILTDNSEFMWIVDCVGCLIKAQVIVLE